MTGILEFCLCYSQTKADYKWRLSGDFIKGGPSPLEDFFVSMFIVSSVLKKFHSSRACPVSHWWVYTWRCLPFSQETGETACSIPFIWPVTTVLAFLGSDKISGSFEACIFCILPWGCSLPPWLSHEKGYWFESLSRLISRNIKLISRSLSRKNSGNSGRLYFRGLQNHCKW